MRKFCTGMILILSLMFVSCNAFYNPVSDFLKKLEIEEFSFNYSSAEVDSSSSAFSTDFYKCTVSDNEASLSVLLSTEKNTSYYITLQVPAQMEGYSVKSFTSSDSKVTIDSLKCKKSELVLEVKTTAEDADVNASVEVVLEKNSSSELIKPKAVCNISVIGKPYTVYDLDPDKVTVDVLDTDNGEKLKSSVSYDSSTHTLDVEVWQKSFESFIIGINNLVSDAVTGFESKTVSITEYTDHIEFFQGNKFSYVQVKKPETSLENEEVFICTLVNRNSEGLIDAVLSYTVRVSVYNAQNVVFDKSLIEKATLKNGEGNDFLGLKEVFTDLNDNNWLSLNFYQDGDDWTISVPVPEEMKGFTVKEQNISEEGNRYNFSYEKSTEDYLVITFNTFDEGVDVTLQYVLQKDDKKCLLYIQLNSTVYNKEIDPLKIFISKDAPLEGGIDYISGYYNIKTNDETKTLETTMYLPEMGTYSIEIPLDESLKDGTIVKPETMPAGLTWRYFTNSEDKPFMALDIVYSDSITSYENVKSSVTIHSMTDDYEKNLCKINILLNTSKTKLLSLTDIEFKIYDSQGIEHDLTDYLVSEEGKWFSIGIEEKVGEKSTLVLILPKLEAGYVYGVGYEIGILDTIGIKSEGNTIEMSLKEKTENPEVIHIPLSIIINKDDYLVSNILGIKVIIRRTVKSQ